MNRALPRAVVEGDNCDRHSNGKQKPPASHAGARYPPTIEELSKAIDSLASGKAPGNHGIAPEVIKAVKQSGLLEHLHELLLQCWEEGPCFNHTVQEQRQ
ncbi:hypothetical protein PoB_002284000 [Plakobranchus ocellatus]|uniref:Uncharacterized protein n=1 Tax=Plakobranchus ocellatus TaxID=259542 RepID=A0AAV3ZKZ1_9GAST|nr:hypothetical protein PoB_002284000 [Plakobranchus ocellatus]